MNTQPDALRLADELEMWTLGEPAAVELRRLHAENVELREAIKRAVQAVREDSIGDTQDRASAYQRGWDARAELAKRIEEASPPEQMRAVRVSDKQEWRGLMEEDAIGAAMYAFCQLASSPEERKQIEQDLIQTCNDPRSALMSFAATIEALLEERNT